ncbi:unnamed protein product (macronuclear) [Paramecium tetraurelia]|uniref:Uncharacterized protein n=1 Tax=Paramecium tetraurelia TaxID=5888 RepID=A0CNS4_PARTE|nr:uncharacterized protein GSPATT00008883001 [Paramecium tetraurelia]CAK72441.1 unnamed protein product [Paramecium tetraurelia]|eukprot:XP_001439838.1 hypothetical protein (macronuclear) [Paramecium tetraurelia strain d4-2]
MQQEIAVFYQPSLEYLNKELEQLKFQCNLKLLQKKVILLFGFPSIKVESDRIHTYLQGIYNQSENEQLKKIRVLISFIGEVTSINNWDDRGLIIRQRVLQFLNIQGLEVKWTEQQWQEEIDSIVTLRTNNPYYDTIPNKMFSYTNLFHTLGIQLPTELKYLKHQSFNQMQTSNLIDDFHLLCNIDEFKIVRNIRQFIQNFTDKLDDFMSLIINIESIHLFDVHSITNSYQTLCNQLQQILISFISEITKRQDAEDQQNQQLIIDENLEEQNKKIRFKKTIPAASSTTIIQGSFGSNLKAKKQRRKLKLIEQSKGRSSLLYLSGSVDNCISQDEIRQSQNSSQIYDNENSIDLISYLQDQLLKNAGLSNYLLTEYSLENLKSKILTYEYIQQKLEQLGYPCINLDEKELISVLEEYKLFNKDKKAIVVKLFNIISESFISKNEGLDPTLEIRDLALKYLSQISIDYPIQELNEILKSQCIPHQKMQDFDMNQKFSYMKLSQILNRKFPEQVYQIRCSSTNQIFQQWSINQLLDIFNFYDLQNIRITRSYISQVFTCLQNLINLKELLHSNIDGIIIEEFMQMEKQFLEVINQPLNFQINSQYFESSNLIHKEQSSNQNDLFIERLKDQRLQISDLDKINELSKLQQQENDQICRQSQDEYLLLKFNQPIISDYFNFLCFQNQSDSPRFSFIDKSQHQSDDQQYNSFEEEYFS